MHVKRPARLLSMLGLVLVLLGAAAGHQAIRWYEEIVLQSADQRLLHTGHTVDRAIDAALEKPLTLLSAAADTPQVRAAWEQDDPRQAALALDGALAEQPQAFCSALTVQDGTPYPVSSQLQGLRFAPQVTPESPEEALVCLDDSGRIYLALLRERSPGRYDGLALDFSGFYDEITAALPADQESYQEQLLLMDARGTTLLLPRSGELTAMLLSDIPDTASAPGAVLLRHQSTGTEGASFVTLSPDTDGKAAVRLAVTPAGSDTNEYFAIGVAADYEAFWSPMRSLAARLVCSAGLVAAGLVLLVILLIRTSGKSRRYRQDLAAVQAKAEAVEALNRKTAQLAHHQRLEMIGTLTSSISHEFNNLLSPIMGYSLMALEKLPEEDPPFMMTFWRSTIPPFGPRHWSSGFPPLPAKTPRRCFAACVRTNW